MSICQRCDMEVAEVRTYFLIGFKNLDSKPRPFSMCIDCWQNLAISSDAKLSILKDQANQYTTIYDHLLELEAIDRSIKSNL